MKKLEVKKEELSVEINFLEGLRQRIPQDPEILKLLGDDYTKSGRWQDGLNVDQELVRLFPEDSLVQYNLACSLSLLGHVRKAVEGIMKAIHFGYRDWNWLMKDSDLENLRKSQEFVPIADWIEKQTKK